jgi:hypothetical protein
MCDCNKLKKFVNSDRRKMYGVVEESDTQVILHRFHLEEECGPPLLHGLQETSDITKTFPLPQSDTLDTMAGAK